MMPVNRRRFLQACAMAGCQAAFGSATLGSVSLAFSGGAEDVSGTIFKNDAPKTLWKWSKQAHLFSRLDDGRVICGICPNRCSLAPGDRSVCRSKVNIDGTLYTLAYGNPCSINVDPIEKKPLYHFLPQTRAFSVAATGCNFRCLNCQNWEISQVKPHEVRHFELWPKDAVPKVKQAGCASIAYTYSEAITYFEYMYDMARAAKPAGIFNLLISNGYINHDPLMDLCGVIDAANINLKSFEDAIYRKLNGGRLQPVLNTLKTLTQQGVHLEITNLVIPGYTDDPAMFTKMVDWIVKQIGPLSVFHLLRFFPRYKLDRLPPTPVSTLERFRDLAIKGGLNYVYIGNVPGHPGNHTYCHACGKMLVERRGYYISQINIRNSRCIFCNTVIPGKWAVQIR